jgi:hypothetical protein
MQTPSGPIRRQQAASSDPPATCTRAGLGWNPRLVAQAGLRSESTPTGADPKGGDSTGWSPLLAAHREPGHGGGRAGRSMSNNVGDMLWWPNSRPPVPTCLLHAHGPTSARIRYKVGGGRSKGDIGEIDYLYSVVALLRRGTWGQTPMSV